MQQQCLNYLLEKLYGEVKMVNVTGWNELQNGTIVESAYLMYNTSFGGSFLLVMFVVLQATLLIKTKNAGLTFGIGAIFLAMFYSMLNAMGIHIIITILIFEMAGAFYQYFFKN